MNQDDKERIDKMTLADMEFVIYNTPSFSWPFKETDTGEYFYERYDKIKGEAEGHLADPY